MFRKTQMVICALMLSAASARGRAQSDSAPARDADAAFQAKDWAKAARLYDDLAKAAGSE